MNIYLIAGPPGIGKSTSSSRFIPSGITIIDQDLAAYQYRKEGFGDLDLYKVEFQNVEENVSVIRGHLSTSDNLKKPIEAFVNLLDAKTNDTLFSKDANPKTGKFVFAVPTGNYIINVTSEGYDEVNLPVNVLGKSDRVFDIEKNIVLIKSGTAKPPVNNKVIPKGK